MKKLLVFGFLVIFILISHAQRKNGAVPELKISIPDDSYIYEQFKSDINSDGYIDRFIILANKNEDVAQEGEDAYFRSLWIMLGSRNGFTKIVDSRTLVFCKSCGGVMGDPFVTIEIKPPYFTIEHYGGSGWRWQSYITFKYSDKDANIYLHKIGNVAFHASNPEEGKVTTKSKKDFGRVNIKEFNIYNQ